MNDYEDLSCELCGKDCGIVCVDCLSCPEPAGYWAWDFMTAHDYLVTLERRAAHVGDVHVKRVMMDHHAVMADALGMTDDGE